jgi:DNA polymerase V
VSDAHNRERLNGVFALVDCNNFFVSCERVYDPSLNERPVVVLSNNDGCIISRCNRVKALGIKMGAPYHQARYLIEKHNVAVLSANFELVEYVSNQVMAVLNQFTPTMEVYSVDEAFLDMTGQKNLHNFGQVMKQTVMDKTGIPVSIGFAPTKTLAKVAADIGKTSARANGVVDLSLPTFHTVALQRLPVDDVWGVGRRLGPQLKAKGIATACHLRDCDLHWAVRYHGSVLARTIMELRGKSCIPLQTVDKPPKSIMASRSFGMKVTHFPWLQEAVATYAAKAAERLRRDRQMAQEITVSIRTNRYSLHDASYDNQATVMLASPTLYTAELIHAAFSALDQIYQPGYLYQKAGVLLTGLVPADEYQLAFWDNPRLREKHAQLMGSVDRLNVRFGPSVHYAAEGFEKPWRMRSANRSDWRLMDHTPYAYQPTLSFLARC